MSYTPWMRSLLNRMKELYNKPNAKTIAEALPELGSGGDVSPSSVASAIHDMTPSQKADTRNNLGAEAKKLVVTVTKSGSTYSADKTYAQINTAYQNGSSIVFVFDRSSAIAEFDDSQTDDAFVAQIVYYGVNGPALLYLIVSENDAAVGYENPLQPAPIVSTVSSTTPTITPVRNAIYKCGTLTSLTVSSPPATGAYSIVFTSGSTATTTTIPSTILGLESFAPEANTMYEINVLDNRAVVGSWEVSV